MKRISSSFNLVESPWIPLRDGGLISLKEAFTQNGKPNIHSILAPETISIFKLLQAIAQAACQVSDKEYQDLTLDSFSKKCLNYLEKWKSCFDIYDEEKPFLQHAELLGYLIKVQPMNNLSLNHVGSWQKKGLSSTQYERNFSDAEIARLLLQQQGFCKGGKALDSNIVLDSRYLKGKSACVGTNLGRTGFLHSFVMGKTLLESILINLFTKEQIKQLSQFPEGLGVPVWEDMPKTENDKAAQRLQKSIMGRLTPMNRFSLIIDEGIKMIEGVIHEDYAVGIADPSITITSSVNKKEEVSYKVLGVRPDYQTWRNLDAILAFLDKDDTSTTNVQVKNGISNATALKLDFVDLMSIGIQVSFNTGEQSLSKSNDSVLSRLFLNPVEVNEQYYTNLKSELSILEIIGKTLKDSIAKVYMQTNSLEFGSAYEKAEVWMVDFWDYCSNYYQELSNTCKDNSEDSSQKRKEFRKKVIGYSYDIFEKIKSGNAQNLSCWVLNKPYLDKYINNNLSEKLDHSKDALPSNFDADAFVLKIHRFITLDKRKRSASNLKDCHLSNRVFRGYSVFKSIGYDLSLLTDDDLTIMSVIASAIHANKLNKNGKSLLMDSLSIADIDTNGIHFDEIIKSNGVSEVCEAIINALKFIRIKQTYLSLDFVSLMNDLMVFKAEPMRVKENWTETYYKNLLKYREEQDEKKFKKETKDKKLQESIKGGE